jgi:hypothetical protein
MKETELLAILYRAEEICEELGISTKDSENFKALNRLIENLEGDIENDQSIM